MRAHAFFCLIIISIALFGQEDARAAFEKSRSQQASGFKAFRSKNDSLFTKFIRDSWRKFELMEPESPPFKSPTEKIPIYDQEFIDDVIWKNWAEDTVILMRSFTPDPLETPDYFPEFGTIELSFYGADITVKYAKELFKTFDAGAGSQALINFWLTAGNREYQTLIQALTEVRNEYALPDYALSLLLDDLLREVVNEAQLRPYYKWFLLNKLGYACRLGYSRDTPIVLIGTTGKIYNKSYFKEEGMYYFVDGNDATDVFTYGSPKMTTLKPFDFAIIDPIDLPLQAKSSSIVADPNRGDTPIDLWHNYNVVQLLSRFPQVDLKYYLQSVSNPLVKKSLEKFLTPKLTPMSELQRVEYLLDFVQSSFSYRTDEQQFGKERVLYPDEFLGYEFSDCDDRVVWLAYLLKQFTDVDLIAVAFPRHVALAVHLQGTAHGETLLFDGRKYIFCDPTYFNAPLGALIPEADRSKGRILKILRD